jgi:hypothetical protein
MSSSFGVAADGSAERMVVSSRKLSRMDLVILVR